MGSLRPVPGSRREAPNIIDIFLRENSNGRVIRPGTILARVSFVSGIFVSIQLGIVFVLLGLASAIIVLGAVFLMVGAWTVIHGLAYESDKVFWTGWGAGVAILASITVLPLSYTLALILIVIIALIVFGMIRSRTSTRAGNWQEGSSKNSHELAFASVSTLFFIL